MKNKFTIPRKTFMILAGITTRQELSRILKGYTHVKNGKEYIYPPRLVEGVDFKNAYCETCGAAETFFSENALKKLKG